MHFFIPFTPEPPKSKTADFGKSERSETRPGESCVEPVEPPKSKTVLRTRTLLKRLSIFSIEAGESELVLRTVYKYACVRFGLKKSD